MISTMMCSFAWRELWVLFGVFLYFWSVVSCTELCFKCLLSYLSHICKMETKKKHNWTKEKKQTCIWLINTIILSNMSHLLYPIMLWKVTITVKQNIQIQMCHFNDHTQCEPLSGSHQRLSGMRGSYLFVFVFIDLQSQEEVFMLERERDKAVWLTGVY